ncbi:hypothetical protein DHEL01_v204254 [Diaporthe helianthi]|uniref:Uncharacterized protein n=1 Tax=Diaporthe helianthi TaxID=158607 RepID=A0A2P5I4B6_DIAHE|nr:hypothetical protein DHEL01_v204254 [Diaporthe helianthi]
MLDPTFNSIINNPSSSNMDYRRPEPDYSESKWRWPSHKFQLRIDSLFGSLYEQYNMVSIPILEPVAFHHDVFEACSTAETLPEFYKLLTERREQRLTELRQCWRQVSTRIATYPPVLDSSPDEFVNGDRWGAFLHFSREFSFDTLATYFAMFTQPSTAPRLPSPSPVPPPPNLTSAPSPTTSPSTVSPIGATLSQPRRKTSSVTISSQPDYGHTYSGQKRRCSELQYEEEPLPKKRRVDAAHSTFPDAAPVNTKLRPRTRKEANNRARRANVSAKAPPVKKRRRSEPDEDEEERPLKKERVNASDSALPDSEPVNTNLGPQAQQEEKKRVSSVSDTLAEVAAPVKRRPRPRAAQEGGDVNQTKKRRLLGAKEPQQVRRSARIRQIDDSSRRK